jgi:uncharacterized protein
MPMSGESARFHEDPAMLSGAVKDHHRAVVSLMEELEAIDWYDQRAEATEDSELAGLLVHNREEETEHAVMLLEWIRRHDAVFDRQLRRYLFTDEPILEIEEQVAMPEVPPGSLGLGVLLDKEGL